MPTDLSFFSDSHSGLSPQVLEWQPMTRKDPEPREELWLIAHQQNETIPVLSLQEWCNLHPEATDPQPQALLEQGNLLLEQGFSVWQLREHLLPAPLLWKGPLDEGVFHS